MADGIQGSPVGAMSPAERKTVLIHTIWIAVAAAIPAVIGYALTQNWGSLTPFAVPVLTALAQVVKTMATDTTSNSTAEP